MTPATKAVTKIVSVGTSISLVDFDRPRIHLVPIYVLPWRKDAIFLAWLPLEPALFSRFLDQGVARKVAVTGAARTGQPVG